VAIVSESLLVRVEGCRFGFEVSEGALAIVFFIISRHQASGDKAEHTHSTAQMCGHIDCATDSPHLASQR